MNINRHNYEEHFILYWDNELTESQKQAVENFVKENADLQEEFKLLGETRFTPDNNTQIEEKEFFLNNSFINITNYEEQLLNYIDDEITAGQRKEIEKIASRYPVVQQELMLLQKTKLQLEAEITFPDKSILYRREEKVRVISMTWFRVAVAAAIILIAGFATFRLVNTNKNGDTPSVAKIDNSKDQPSGKKTDSLISDPDNQIQKDPRESVVNTNEKSAKNKTSDKNGNKKSVDKNEVPKYTIAQRENKNNLPEERKNTIDPNETTDIASLPDRKKDDAIIVKNQPDAINADFHNQDVTLNANPTLYIPGPKEKENGGIKEFLRKTTRVFERRTRIQTTTDDNKLLVGVFAVSLK